MKRIDFLQGMENCRKEDEIYTPRTVCIFLHQKKSLNYGEDEFTDVDTEVSEEWASRSLPVKSGLSQYTGTNRIIVNSRMYYWAQKSSEGFPNELKVYYEDDDFICYFIEQNEYYLNNFAIDYGYNSGSGSSPGSGNSAENTNTGPEPEVGQNGQQVELCCNHIDYVCRTAYVSAHRHLQCSDEYRGKHLCTGVCAGGTGKDGTAKMKRKQNPCCWRMNRRLRRAGRRGEGCLSDCREKLVHRPEERILRYDSMADAAADEDGADLLITDGTKLEAEDVEALDLLSAQGTPCCYFRPPGGRGSG